MMKDDVTPKNALIETGCRNKHGSADSRFWFFGLALRHAQYLYSKILGLRLFLYRIEVVKNTNFEHL